MILLHNISYLWKKHREELHNLDNYALEPFQESMLVYEPIGVECCDRNELSRLFEMYPVSPFNLDETKLISKNLCFREEEDGACLIIEELEFYVCNEKGARNHRGYIERFFLGGLNIGDSSYLLKMTFKVICIVKYKDAKIYSLRFHWNHLDLLSKMGLMRLSEYAVGTHLTCIPETQRKTIYDGIKGESYGRELIKKGVNVFERTNIFDYAEHTSDTIKPIPPKTNILVHPNLNENILHLSHSYQEIGGKDHITFGEDQEPRTVTDAEVVAPWEKDQGEKRFSILVNPRGSSSHFKGSGMEEKEIDKFTPGKRQDPTTNRSNVLISHTLDPLPIQKEPREVHPTYKSQVPI